MAQPTIASAVVLPDPSPSPPRSPSPRVGTKRRQSPTRNDSPKRQRLSPSPEASAQDNVHSEHSPVARPARPTKRVDERKRSQRLFGALLGGLGQTPSSNPAAAKRRAEQEERRRHKEHELGQRQKSRLETLNHARKKEQPRIDEANMRIRHQNMRAMANFLSTATEPKLYFQPWELLPDQHDQINRQRQHVDAQIDRELDDFDQIRQHGDHTNHHQHPENDTTKDNAFRPEPAHGPAPELAPGPAPEPALGVPEEQELREQLVDESERQRKESIDDTGDIVVEADEDTVIY